jgi:hypothetical protein
MVLYIFPPELFIVSPDSEKNAAGKQKGLNYNLTERHGKK